jgi:LysR family hydrogen peroxide-inducible transcriptional activator
MYDGLEFRHLASFVAVADECSFSKAAERLNISQPSLSSQIKQVENGLRANLFIRSQTGASLTRPGAQFLVFARQMLHMRDDAVRATSSDQTGTEWPLRFGYTPFADHKLVDEALTGYRELVPGGLIQSSSECSAELATMVADGRLDAAIVNFPVTEKDLFAHAICQEKMSVCLRADDPLASGDTLPKEAIAGRLNILFARVHQPLLYDALMQKFARAGIELNPSEFVSAPSEMQFLVKSGRGFGLVREGAKLDPALTMRSIAGINLAVTTGFICRPAQIRPVLPMLAYRLEKQCTAALKIDGRKRPNGRVTGDNLDAIRKSSRLRSSA